MRRTLLLVLSTCLVASGLAAAWVSASARLRLRLRRASRTVQALMDVAMTVREGRTPGDVRADPARGRR